MSATVSSELSQNIFGRRETLRAGLLLVLLLVGAVLETAGIGLIFPLISMLNDPGINARQPLLAWLYEHLKITSPRQFLFVSSGALIGFYVFKNAFLALVTRFQLGFICENHVRVSSSRATFVPRTSFIYSAIQRTSSATSLPISMGCSSVWSALYSFWRRSS